MKLLGALVGLAAFTVLAQPVVGDRVVTKFSPDKGVGLIFVAYGGDGYQVPVSINDLKSVWFYAPGSGVWADTLGLDYTHDMDGRSVSADTEVEGKLCVATGVEPGALIDVERCRAVPLDAAVSVGDVAIVTMANGVVVQVRVDGAESKDEGSAKDAVTSTVKGYAPGTKTIKAF